MPKFRIVPHNRLQEWVAEEKGCFLDDGLDYVLPLKPISERTYPEAVLA